MTAPRNQPPHSRRQKLAALAKAVEANAARPRCGARAKGTGEPCQNPGLENGRCRYHGGLTPKGAQWHRVQFPKKGAPIEKLEKKLQDIKRRHKQAAARRARMTPEELAIHETRRRACKPGTPAERAMRRQDREAGALLKAARDAQTVSTPQATSERPAPLCGPESRPAAHSPDPTRRRFDR